MRPQRVSVIKNTLDKRQPDLTMVMENVRKPHNLAAVARTLEAIGGMDIHAITSLTSIHLSQMAAGGVRKWIKVNLHQSTGQALDNLKQQGFQIIATTLCETSKDFRDIDYTTPTAILVGEELEGISNQAVMMANEKVTIPMAGMVQSLNVSVASALILYEAYRQREKAGMYRSCSLDKNTYRKLLFEACHRKIAQYCRDKKLPYPAMNDEAEILEPIADSKTYSDGSFADWLKKNS